MSIKTNKRLALGVIAALVFAPFAAIAPASAATGDFAVTVSNTANVATPAAATATQAAGANNFVGATLTVVAATPFAISVVGGTASSTTPGVTGSGTSNLNVNTAAGTTSVALVIPTPTVGTITVFVYDFTNGAQNATAVSKLTVTVNAALNGTLYTFGTAFINTTVGALAQVDTAAASLTAAGANSATEVARLSVTQYHSADTTTVTATASTKTVVVSVAGAGLVDTLAGAGATRSSIATVAAGASTSGLSEFLLFPDGRTGTATVTITVDGKALSTKTFLFTGVLASYSVVEQKVNIGIAETGTLTVSGKDANGNAASLGTVYATSAGTAVATVAVAGSVATVTGVKAGSTTVTIHNAATLAASTITSVHNIVITKVTAASVVLTSDKSTYLPGEKVTLTVTATDSNGSPVADGSRNLFEANVTSSVALQGALPLIAVTLKGGIATYVTYAPLAVGTVILDGKEGANTDSTTKAAVTRSFTVATPVVPVVVPPVVYDNPTLSFVKDGRNIILSGTAVDGEGDIIIYVKRVGKTAWTERAKTLEVAAPGDFNGTIRAPKNNVLIRVKQEGTGQFSNQVIVLK